MGLNGNEQNALNEMKEQRTYLEQMIRSEGWRLFRQTFEFSASQAYEAMAKSDTAFPAAKHMGAYHAIKNALDWPLRQQEILTKQINAMVEGAIRRDPRK